MLFPQTAVGYSGIPMYLRLLMSLTTSYDSICPFAVLNGTQLDPRFWQIGDGGGDGPPIPGKSGMGTRMGIGGSAP